MERSQSRCRVKATLGFAGGLLSAFASCGEASLHQQLTAYVPPVSVHSSSAPCNSRLEPSPVGKNTRHSKTALNMGLRSFLKKKVLGRKDDENGDEAADDVEQWLNTGTQDYAAEYVEEVEEVEDVAPGTRQVESRAVERRSWESGEETIQERVTRLKSGRMTEDEKAAFLHNTLAASSSNTVSGGAAKPLRQKIPSPDDPASKKRADLLQNTISRAASKIDSNRITSPPKLELDSDRKKREYLEMVTNPNRFKSYIATRTAEEPSVPLDSFISDDENSDSSDSSSDNRETVDSSNDSPPIGSPGLASRLEAAAGAEEIRKMDLQKQQEEEKQRQLQKLAEVQRMRNEEIARRETEALERRKQQEEEQRREEEERRLAEEEQQRKLMEAQEAYWKKKLEDEREQRQQALEREEAEKAKIAAEEEGERERARQLQDQERARIREAERQREDPHEGEILKEAAEKKIHDREEAWEITEQAAAQMKGTEPSKEVPNFSLNSVLGRQARQKAAIDQQKEAQLEQLKSLNSPLPSPRAQNNPPSVSPVIQQDQTHSPTTPSTEPRKTVKDMMAEVDEEKPKPAAGGAMGSGLSRLLTLGNQNKSKEPESSNKVEAPTKGSVSDAPPRKPVGQASANESSPKKPVRQPLPGSVNKKVVRQQLPLGDEGDDFDEFTRNGPNKDMSIADAMEKSGGVDNGDEDPVERSRRWGIDISKFK